MRRMLPLFKHTILDVPFLKMPWYVFLPAWEEEQSYSPNLNDNYNIQNLKRKCSFNKKICLLN